MWPCEGGTWGLMSAQAAISASATTADARNPCVIATAVGRIVPAFPWRSLRRIPARRARSGRLVLPDLRAYALNRTQYRLVRSERRRKFIKSFAGLARTGETAVQHGDRRLLSCFRTIHKNLIYFNELRQGAEVLLELIRVVGPEQLDAESAQRLVGEPLLGGGQPRLEQVRWRRGGGGRLGRGTRPRRSGLG